jgi:hypothetical protein
MTNVNVAVLPAGNVPSVQVIVPVPPEGGVPQEKSGPVFCVARKRPGRSW